MELVSKPKDSEATPPAPPEAPQSTFLSDHFAVLLVFAVFVLMLLVYVMEIHWSGNDTVTTWLQNKISDLIAALLMGLTGGAISAARSGK